VRLLVVTTKCPYPLNEGRALRTYNLLREAAREHEIVLCTFVQSEAEQRGLEQMRSFCAEVHGVPLYMRGRWLSLAADLCRGSWSEAPILAIKYRRRAMQALLGRLVEQGRFDAVHLDMLHLGELLPVVRRYPVVLVEHNVETALWERRVDNERSPLRRAYLRGQLRKLRSYEAGLCRRVQHVVTVSDRDAEALRAAAGPISCTTVPNAVDVEYFKPTDEPVEPGGLVYVGGLGWHPNLDAIDYFAEHILPKIAAVAPEVRLTVIGQLPGNNVIEHWRGNARVRCAGLVDDIRPLVARAAVFIVPLRIGGGTRLKILDALAMGKAVVSTAIGCEGLAVTHGRDILIADDAAEFAAAVVRVLQDASLRLALGRHGRACVEEHYRWPAAARRMETAYRSAVQAAAQVP
jgi:polysaccharide biosynthesis protein PslH